MSDELEGVNLLDLAPYRRAEWEVVDGAVVVTRPKPSGWGPASWADRLSFALSMRKIRLDDFGSYAWQRLEASRTVREIATDLRQEFGDSIEPAEERLGQFVRSLRRERLLGYPEWDGHPADPQVLPR